MRFFVGSVLGAVIVVATAVAWLSVDNSSAREVEVPSGRDTDGRAVDDGPVAQEPIDSLVDAAGEQEPSVFKTYDYGPAPSLDMLNPVSPRALEEKKEHKGWVLGDHFGDIVTVGPEPSEPRAEQQGNKLARASDGPVEPPEPTYDARAQPWNALPPARVAESSDDCIGFCFDAIVESVDRDDARVARVVVFGDDGAPTRAIVERTRMTDQSRSATYYGTAVRFSCFERANAGPVPRFEGCAQMARERRDHAASRGRTSRQESDAKMFDLADPL